RQLAHQHAQMLLNALALRDVAEDSGDAEDPAVRSTHRRDIDRDIEHATVRAAPLGVAQYVLAEAQVPGLFLALIACVFSEQEPLRLSNHFVGRITEHALGAGVPRLNDAVARHANEAVGRAATHL